MKGHAKERKPSFVNRACFSSLKLQINEICYVEKCFLLWEHRNITHLFKEPHLNVVPNGSKLPDKVKLGAELSKPNPAFAQWEEVKS